MKNIAPTRTRIRRRWLLTILAGLLFCPLATSLSAQEKPAATTPVSKIFAGSAPTSVEELAAMQQHVQTLSEKVIPCTVGIQIGPAQGSGVIISEDGYVLTAAHVAGKPDREATLILPDGKKIKAKTLGMNYGIDAGLMKIIGPEKKWPHLEMGVSSALKPGQWCLATGHPGGYQPGRKPVVRLGRVLENIGAVVVTDCALVGGDSGGPLLDMDGKVIGIHSRIGQQLTANMHVPVNTYRDTWDRLTDGEAWGKFGGRGPFLGVQGDPQAEGAKIIKVYPDTPAAKAGVKVGDVIIKFDGKDVANFTALSSLVRGKKPGDKVKIVLRRGEEMIELQVVLGKRGG